MKNFKHKNSVFDLQKAWKAKKIPKKNYNYNFESFVDFEISEEFAKIANVSVRKSLYA